MIKELTSEEIEQIENDPNRKPLLRDNSIDNDLYNRKIRSLKQVLKKISKEL